MDLWQSSYQRMLDDEQQQELMELLLQLADNKGSDGQIMTRVYIGCDSVREKRGLDANNKPIFWAKYATVLIVHKDGSRGCRVFRHVSYERDYDQKANRPKLRMLNETAKSIQMFNENAHLIDEFNPEIHLDISVQEVHGSSCAAKEAAGMVLSMTGLEAKLKPESWAASFGADGVAHGFDQRTTSRKVAA